MRQAWLLSEVNKSHSTVAFRKTKPHTKRLTRASDLIVGLTIKFGSGCSMTGLETIGTPGCRWVGGLGASCYRG